MDTAVSTHTPACAAETVTDIAAIEAWTAAWPRHCRKCLGRGYHEWTENGAPMGEGYWPMPMSEVCETCFPNCPRCGESRASDEEDRPCLVCGWWDGNMAGDACPETHECWGDCTREDD